MKTEIRYKFLNGNESKHGEHKWRLNKWYKIDGDLEICVNGFHCSKYIPDALCYVQGDTLAFVEVRGESIITDNKECWSEMRVIKRYKWKKEHSIKLAIFSARLCLSAFEEVYPDDVRPRKAIEAAEICVENPTEGNLQAARSAAESAAWSAAESAESAARSAAMSARSAAWSAAESAAKQKMHEYVLSLFEG